MRVPVLTLVLTISLAPSIRATPTSFPYEAVVQKDGEVVRKGPGERYDPTMKLPAGTQVTVIQHHPGGWYQIAPPPGSFSWIDATYVERTASDEGVVHVPAPASGLAPRVVVWIGSEFSDERNVFGRQLANGDKVRILGERTLQAERGPTTFYRIEPPRHEYRYLKGDFVVSRSEAASIVAQPLAAGGVSTRSPTSTAASLAQTPGAGPLLDEAASSPPGFPVEHEPTLIERELTRAIDSQAVRRAGVDPARLAADRDRLLELDARLQEMLAQDPGAWRLDEMEAEYRELQGTATSSVASMVDTRLSAITGRRKIKAEYDAFVQVTSETSQRDAALLSMQSAPQTPGALALSGSPEIELGMSQPFPHSTPIPAVPTGPVPGTTPAAPITPSPGSPVAVNTVSPLDGAGVIQRLRVPTPGAPPHVLVTPQGNLLAYLQAGPGLNLDAYLGQSLGVIGQRTHDPRLRADRIVVRQVTPVRLQP
jgi:hypothetical protein